MKALFTILAITVLSFDNTASDLQRHFNAEITLTTEQLKQTTDSVIHYSDDDTQLSHAYFQRARLYFDSAQNLNAIQNFFKAITHLSVSKKQNPKLSWAIWNDMGLATFKVGYFKESAKHYDQAITSAKLADRLDLLLMTLEYKGRAVSRQDWQGALKLYQQALNSVEKSGEERIKRLVGKGRNLAISERQQIQQNQAIRSRIHNRIGLLFKDARALKEAEEYFRLSLSFAVADREKARALHNLAQVFYYKEDFIKEEEYLLEATAFRKGSKKYLTLVDLGECLIKQGRNEEAIIYLLEAEQMVDMQSVSLRGKVYEWLVIAAKDPIPYYGKLAQRKDEAIEALTEIKTIQQQAQAKLLLSQLHNTRQLKEENQRKEDWAYKAFGLIGLFLIIAMIRMIVMSNRGKRTRKRNLEAVALLASIK